MRVTRSMMVNNMSYWVSQQAEKLVDAQTVIGSGKKVNKPSDAPLAAGQILSDRASISQYGQYESNIAYAKTWVGASDATLSAAYTTMQNARNAVLLSGGTGTAATIGVLTNFYNDILSLANSRYASGYMYAGNLSDTLPFANDVNITGGVPADIIFDLASAATNVTIQINDSTGTVVRNITVGAGGVAGTNTIVWNGLDDLNNPLPDGQYNFTITALNVTDPVAAYPTYRGDAGGKDVLTGVNERVVLNNNGGNLFSNILNNLSQAITAIINNTADVSVIGVALQQSATGLQAKQVELAHASIQLESASARLLQLKTNAEDRISNLEIGSTAEEAIKLKTQQTTYEEVISITADMLKMPKLTDYL